MQTHNIPVPKKKYNRLIILCTLIFVLVIIPMDGCCDKDPAKNPCQLGPVIWILQALT